MESPITPMETEVSWLSATMFLSTAMLMLRYSSVDNFYVGKSFCVAVVGCSCSYCPVCLANFGINSNSFEEMKRRGP